jgi:hypothetical protein
VKETQSAPPPTLSYAQRESLAREIVLWFERETPGYRFAPADIARLSHFLEPVLSAPDKYL